MESKNNFQLSILNPQLNMKYYYLYPRIQNPRRGRIKQQHVGE